MQYICAFMSTDAIARNLCSSKVRMHDTRCPEMYTGESEPYCSRRHLIAVQTWPLCLSMMLRIRPDARDGLAPRKLNRALVTQGGHFNGGVRSPASRKTDILGGSEDSVSQMRRRQRRHRRVWRTYGFDRSVVRKCRDFFIVVVVYGAIAILGGRVDDVELIWWR